MNNFEKNLKRIEKEIKNGEWDSISRWEDDEVDNLINLIEAKTVVNILQKIAFCSSVWSMVDGTVEIFIDDTFFPEPSEEKVFDISNEEGTGFLLSFNFLEKLFETIIDDIDVGNPIEIYKKHLYDMADKIKSFADNLELPN